MARPVGGAAGLLVGEHRVGGQRLVLADVVQDGPQLALRGGIPRGGDRGLLEAGVRRRAVVGEGRHVLGAVGGERGVVAD
jgi:hypothetical protein